jgi:hypothetical protein
MRADPSRSFAHQQSPPVLMVADSCKKFSVFASRAASSPRFIVFAYLALAIIAIGLSLVFFAFTVDDSYITFRYGQTFAEHGIWNWNSRGPLVEAYTSFSYAVLGLAAALLSLSPVLVSKIVGAILMGLLAVRLSLEIKNSLTRLIGLTVLCANPFTYIHAFSGLETPLFILLIVEMGILLSKPKINPIYFCFLALLLPMTRPEGVLISFCSVLICAHKGLIDRNFKAALLFAGAVGVSYLAARFLYFHSLFPTSFIVKHSAVSDADIVTNLLGGRFYLAALGVSIFCSKGTTRYYLIALLALVFIAYVPNRLLMNYSDRFFFQVAFPGVLVALATAGTVGNRKAMATVAAFMLLLAMNPDEIKDAIEFGPYLSHANASLGKHLHRLGNENLVLMTGDAGAIPYFSGWETVDFVGLGSQEVAVDGGVTPAMLSEYAPDLVLLYSDTPDKQGIDLMSVRQGLILDYVEKNAYEQLPAIKWRSFYFVPFLKRGVVDMHKIEASVDAVHRESFAYAALPANVKLRRAVLGQEGLLPLL